MNNITSYLFLLFLVVLSSCVSETHKHQQVYDALIGKQICIPKNLPTQILEDSIEYDELADFSIVTLVTSEGCTPCSMKLKAWNDFLNIVMSNVDVDVRFLMIIESDPTPDIIHNLKINNFLHPVSFDSKYSFSTKNPIPKEAIYHTFLLDSENKIIAIGNPASNPKIADLFIQIIKEDSEEATYYPDEILVRITETISRNDTITKTFTIENNSNTSFTIQGISTSCDCVSVLSNNDTIRPWSVSEINLTWKADSDIGRFIQYADVYFNEKKKPTRLIIRGYVKQ